MKIHVTSFSNNISSIFNFGIWYVNGCMFADCWHPMYAYMNVPGMGDTLIFSHIRRLRPNLGVHFNIFGVSGK